jgi:two-component system cell cycle response regulator
MEVESIPPVPEARRILIVDDDDGRRVMLSRVLTHEGYEVECLPDGSELLDRCQERTPDLVLLDLMLPGISGFELCGDLRMLEEMKLTPIVLITSAHVDEESVVRGLLCGADDYLVTPSRLSELRARIRVQLRNRRDRELLQWARARGASFRSAAMCDALTGLANRRALDREIDATLGGEEPFLIVMIDIDHFKSINDTYGHSTGDRVLAEVGRAIGSRARSRDLAGRWGGEEFVVLVRGAPAGSAASIGERYRAAIAQIPAFEGGPAHVTASVGVTSKGPLGEPIVTREALIASADTALYAAKRAGRDCVVVAENPASVAPKSEEVA